MPDLVLSPGTRVGQGTAPKNYSYDFGQVPGTQTFTITNNGTAASETLNDTGCCSPHFAVSNDTCDGQALAPGGTCTFDLTFTAAMGGCNPGDLFTTSLDINGSTPSIVHYIHLDAQGECPQQP